MKEFCAAHAKNHKKYKEMFLTLLATIDERYYTENLELDFSFYITRTIIYALSEPQMVLGKSQRKNLRPSFLQTFLSTTLDEDTEVKMYI